MAQTHRDLVVWRLAVDLKKEVYRLIDTSDARHDWWFRDQLRNAAAAIAAHIREGFGRYSPRDFGRFLSYAFSSLSETEHWLEDGVDRNYWTDSDLGPARRLLRRLTPGLLNLQRYLQRASPPDRHADGIARENPPDEPVEPVEPVEPDST